jgi:TRAP-type C4-dicarboxylate transport system substrate-binding protein
MNPLFLAWRTAALPLALILSLAAVPANAEEVTLRAVSAFADHTRFSANFERFVEKVNAEGKGLVQIRYLGGGGKVMNPFEVGNAVRGGVVDMANVTGAFYTNLMPEADALKLSERTIQELRANGGWAFINKLHNEKLNAYFLARQFDGVPFHLYLTHKIDKPDLTGLKLRVTPVYQAFFTALGATAIRTDPGEVYTALERGVVEGYGWPIQGVFDLGWQEVTKFRVDPGFYSAELNVLVNLTKWNGLNDAQRELLIKMGTWLESLNAENARINAEEAARQVKAGIQVIVFSPEETQRYLKTAHDAAWGRVLEVSPENGPKLKALLTK